MIDLLNDPLVMFLFGQALTYLHGVATNLRSDTLLERKKSKLLKELEKKKITGPALCSGCEIS